MDARRVLQMTYVFAYYLQKNAQSQIFEENQADLQMQTEQLSQYLEQRADGVEDFQTLKQQVRGWGGGGGRERTCVCVGKVEMRSHTHARTHAHTHTHTTTTPTPTCTPAH